MLAEILLFSVALSAFPVLGLAFFYLKERTIDRAMLPLTAFASGAMIGVSLLYILPTALQATPSASVTLSATLFGVMVFFILERVFYWHHLHEGLSEAYTFSRLNILGDAVHNLVNGIAIGAAFLVSQNILVGLMVTFALMAHAVPQELSDFALLLHGGMNKGRALAASLASASMVIVGGLAVFFFLNHLNIGPYLLALAGGAFIYIAAVDLVPRLHLEEIRNRSVVQLAFFLVGAILIQMIAILSQA